MSKKFTPINSKILGVDKLNIESIPGVYFYKGDIFEDEVLNYIKSFFEKNRFNNKRYVTKLNWK